MSALVTVTLGTDDVTGWIIAAAVLVGSVAVLVRPIRKIHVTLRNLLRIAEGTQEQVSTTEEKVSRELEHNHGSSMKDDLHGVAVAVGTLQREFTDFKRDFYHHLAEKGPQSP